MPIYEYECGSCGHRFEAIQKMSDPVLIDCPACNKAGLKKLMSAAGFQLKGTGWYATDFKNGQKKEKKPESDSTPPKKKTDGCGGGTCGCAS
ncbi:MAG: FmdB family zinc ribbon protein [Sulfuricaulis sp.]